MGPKSKHLQVRVTADEKARLKRLASSAGQDVSSYVLGRVLPSAQERFDTLVRQLEREEEPGYVLAELNDLLSSLIGAELADAVAHAPVGTLSPFLDNYVAALVEQACHRSGILPPPWASRVEPLDTPWFATPSPGLRLHLLRSAPVPFKRRNLFVDTGIGGRV